MDFPQLYQTRNTHPAKPDEHHKVKSQKLKDQQAMESLKTVRFICTKDKL